MRVIHVASGREWRGGQRQTYYLARALANAPGIESLVVTRTDSQLHHALASEGVQCVAVPWTIGLDPRALVALFREVKAGDVVHAHDSHAHAMVDVIARVRPVTVIATRRVNLPIRTPTRWRRAAATIALSQPIRARLLNAGVAKHRVSIIPPAIEFPPVDAEWPQVLSPLTPGLQLVISIAALTPEKGVDILLDAASLLRVRFPNLRVVVFGDGPERRALSAHHERLGLGPMFTLVGQQPTPEALLRHAAIYVQPSRSEGFGSSVLDAMARGVPVVATDTGGLPEALAGGGGQIVPAENAAAMAAAVAMMLNNPAARQQIGAAGRIAAQGFGIERLVARTMDVYRSAVMETIDR